MGGGGSAVVRRQLGDRLRRLRVAAGKDIADVTYARLASKAKMSRIENGRQPVRIADVLALCDFYGADAATTAALRAMAPGTQEDGWWEPGPGAIQEWFGLYAGLEASANRIRCCEPLVVSGLVQTEAYARAVISSRPGLAPEVVEQRVRLRMQRQKRPMDGVTLIMSEGALQFGIGSSEIMSDQLDHLRASAVDIRILPFGAGQPPLPGYWAMLEFENPDDPSVVYVEGAGIARYLDKPKDWAEYDSEWKMVEDRAVPMGEWSA